MYRISFHEHFRRTLAHLSEKNKNKRSLIFKCLRKLQSGDWGGGTRVKRLQGSNIDILEARVNDSDRLLFSLGQEQLLVCHDVVEHDAVNRRAGYCRINADDKYYQVDDRDLLDGLTPPIDEDPYIGTDTEPVEDAWRTTYINNTAPRLTTPPAEVWQDEQRLADWCAEMDLDIDLVLHPTQEEVVLNPRPIILSGGAGSGKSTIVLHSLIRHVNAAPDSKSKILYITFMQGLCQRSQDLYHKLASRNSVNTQKSRGEVIFLTYDDLCQRLILDSPAHAPDGKLLTQAEFTLWYDRLPNFSRSGLASEAWAEIQGVIKGRIEKPDQEMLTYEQYDEMGKREGLIDEQGRTMSYRFAETYQRFLKKQKKYDQMDLTRLAWSALLGLPEMKREQWRYDALFCDEVQDLTKLQLRLLRELWNGGRTRPFLTGDEHQVIYPSAFQWADIQQFFYEDSKAQLYVSPDKQLERYTLTRNFRSTDGILKVAQATLMGLKKELLAPFNNYYRFTPPPRGSHDGPNGLPPVRIQGSEAECLQIIARLPANARRVILTRTKEESEALIEKLQDASANALVDTIENYKGLEADCVILWRFFVSNQSFWRNVQHERNYAHSLYDVLTECNRLYVGLTRAQRYLAIFDAPDDPVPWNLPAYQNILLKVVGCDWLQNVQTAASTPEQWRERASLYETHQNYRLAIAAYKNAADKLGILRCEALQSEDEGRFADAAEQWYQIEQWQKAHSCFVQAAHAQGQARCDAEIFEETGKWVRARDAWQRAGKWDREASVLEMLGQWQAAQECWRHHKDNSALQAFELRWLARELVVLGQELTKTATDVAQQTIKLSRPYHRPEDYN